MSSARPASPTILVTIDEIVAHDLPRGTEAKFAEALRHRLAELIQDSAGEAADWPARTESSRRTPAATAAFGDPVELGHAVAGSVFGLVSGRDADRERGRS